MPAKASLAELRATAFIIGAPGRFFTSDEVSSGSSVIIALAIRAISMVTRLRPRTRHAGHTLHTACCQGRQSGNG